MLTTLPTDSFTVPSNFDVNFPAEKWTRAVIRQQKSPKQIPVHHHEGHYNDIDANTVGSAIALSGLHLGEL